MSELVDLVRERVQLEEAHYLWKYLPGMREETEELRFLQLKARGQMAPDLLSHSMVEAIGVYESTWSVGRPTLMRFDAFAKGASTLSVMLTDPSRDLLLELTSRVLGEIEMREEFPLISELLAPYLIRVGCSVLRNGEFTTREELLSYNHGVWWALGHVAGLQNAYVDGISSLDDDRPLVDWIYDVMTRRAELGTITE